MRPTKARHETNGGDRWFAQNGWRVVRLPNALVTGGGDLALGPIRPALSEAR